MRRRPIFSSLRAALICVPALLCCVFYVSARAESYLDPQSLAPTLIDPPYAESSDEWKKDVEAILALQKRPYPKELAAAEQEREMSPEMVAEEVNVSRKKNPTLFHLLDRVGDTSRAVTDGTKKYWKARRPYLADDRVKALIPAHANPAYPSGHTCGAYSWAHALAAVFPEKRAAFMRRAEQIAQHRVLVGMHYPHDIEGGKTLALLIAGALSQDEEFLDDLAAAKKEAKTK
ncbi:MAG: phosphatase PAP2 family protein [Rickettsiales bacterium]